MTQDALPTYLSLALSERGERLGIDFHTYRQLVHTVFGVIEPPLPSLMAIYRTDCGCALDIFSSAKCLTLSINSTAKQLCLFSCDLDSTQERCLVSLSTSVEDWKRLGEIARKEILCG
jgi:hypothetical protein